MLKERVKLLGPELVVFRRDTLGLPNREVEKDKDRSGPCLLEIGLQPVELSRPQVAPALVLGIIQQNEVTVLVIERLVKLPEAAAVNLPGLFGMGVMVSGNLVVGRVYFFDDLLIFVPLLLLAARAVAVDEVADVDDQRRVQSVDFGDEAFK